MIKRSRLVIISVILLAEILFFSLFFITISFSQTNKYEHAVQETSTNQSARLLDLETSNHYVYTLSKYNSTGRNVDFTSVNLTQFDTNLNPIWTTNYSNPFYTASQHYDENILAATDQSVLIGSYYSTTNLPYSYSIINKDGIQSTFNMTEEHQEGHLLGPIAMGLDYFVAYERYNSSNSILLTGYKLFPNGDNATLFKQKINSYANEKPYYKDKNTIVIPFYSTFHSNFPINATYAFPLTTIGNFRQLEYNTITNSTNIVEPPLGLVTKYNQIRFSYYSKGFFKNYKLSLSIFPYKNSYLFFETDQYSNKSIIQISTLTENLTKYSTDNLIYPINNLMDYIYPYYVIYPTYQISDKYYFNVGVYNKQTKQVITQLVMYSTSQKIINLESYSYTIQDNYSLEFSFTSKLNNGIIYYGMVNHLQNSDPAYYFIKFYRIVNNPLNFVVYLALPFKFLIGAIFVLPTAYYLIRRSIPKTTNSELYPEEK